MLPFKSKRSSLLAFGFLLLLVAGVLLLFTTQSVDRQRLGVDPVEDLSGIDAEKPLSQNEPRPVKTPRRTAQGGGLDSEERWDFDEGGQPLSIRLALDEAVVRQADGKDRIIALDPPATDETLPARLAALKEEGVVMPVAYLVDGDRSAEFRRIVTPDLRVQLGETTAETIADANQLVIKDRPEYAPGWVIMTAASPFAALDAMVNLRAIAEVASADVLLAAQQSLRALPNDALITNQWHLKKTSASSANTDINVETVWNYPSATGTRGAGLRIGIVDDGMQTNHPDLAPNADTANDKDWNGNDSDPNPGTDDDHGTACAGNAAAKGNNTIGVSGSAPDATLVGMRLIAAATTDAQEAEAMYYLPNLIQIKSNSWGPNDTGSLLEAPGTLTRAALKNAAELGRNGRGNIILWAGGNGGGVNDNSNYDGYANSIYTIAIGATTSAGNRASYSEPGSNVVVCAPSNGGLGITTVDRTGSNGYGSGDYTSSFGGTSSATPTAAGVVALMLEKNPNLGWRDVQEILIRSAYKIKPTDADWTTNGAGISFNHNFGAGLVDATAAVNLANGWTNLSAHQNAVSTQSNLNVAIPNNNATGISRSFNLTSSNIRVEHVTVKVSINHNRRGELAISLKSPGGMSSRLAEVRSDSNSGYDNWTFSTVRNWGESSSGVWTLTVADRSNTGNTTGGTLTAAELTVFGSAAAPVNPSPLVQITQPAANASLSPGTNLQVLVNATDLALGGAPGVISSVSLFDNNVLIGTSSTAPYSFSYTPALGNHRLVATATDSEGATGTSSSVDFTVVNQTPVISAASLSATGQVFSDTPLTVSSITATDAENQPLTYSYQWQSSNNQVTYTDIPSAITATAPVLAGSLLRCVITASDGIAASTPFTTASVNVLLRPPGAAAIGGVYSYTSGLVLRGSGSTIGRQAIIHEFSQGPSGGTAEWIELLTLREGSLAFWDLQDESGNILVFADSPVWDDIPAGTLIVIYNGSSRDPLLPPDDLNPSDGRMIISSSNGAYFDQTLSDSWLPLGNSGDSIFLSDSESDEIDSLSYGNSLTGGPNVGNVGSSKSAFFTGDSDSGAEVAANWIVTTSTSARSVRTPRAAGDLFISEVVEGLSNNKAVEIYNPGNSSVDLSAEGYKLELYSNGSASVGNSLLLTGTVAPGATHVVKNNSSSGLIAGVTAQQSSGSINFNGNDAIVLRKGTSLVDCFGQIGFNPGSAWTSNGVTTLDSTLRRKPSVIQGDVVSNNAFDPSLEWEMFPVDTLEGLGSHSLGQPNPSLSLVITPSTFSESAGASAASGVVSIPAALGTNLVVNLVSPDLTEVSVPATVTITAGQTSSSSFPVAAVDDALSDGAQTVTIIASAVGYNNANSTVTVTDDEASLEGVTPGLANSPANQVFINALRNGSLNAPALFRLGSGANVPDGLTLNAQTGVLSGTIGAGNPPGNYQIVIERYNSFGETVSQSFTLVLSAGSSNTFASWISTQNVGSLNGFLDDPDGDGLANGIENHLGTLAASSSLGLTEVSSTPTTIVFRHSRSNTPASDVSASYEWSTSLVDWHPSGGTSGTTTVTISPATILDVTAPANDLIEVTALITGTSRDRVFVRMKAMRQ